MSGPKGSDRAEVNDQPAQLVGDQHIKSADGQRIGLSGSFAFFAMATLFLGTVGYIILFGRSHPTTMISEHGMRKIGSSLPIAAFIYLVVCLPFMMSGLVNLAKRLFIGAIIVVCGSLGLMIELDDYANATAEAKLFAHGGVMTVESFPILGTSVARGRGVVYRAIFNRMRRYPPDMEISVGDFERVGSNGDITWFPANRYCADFPVETRGRHRRIMWSEYKPIPSSWIVKCAPNNSAVQK